MLNNLETQTSFSPISKGKSPTRGRKCFPFPPPLFLIGFDFGVRGPFETFLPEMALPDSSPPPLELWLPLDFDCGGEFRNGEDNTSSSVFKSTTTGRIRNRKLSLIPNSQYFFFIIVIDVCYR